MKTWWLFSFFLLKPSNLSSWSITNVIPGSNSKNDGRFSSSRVNHCEPNVILVHMALVLTSLVHLLEDRIFWLLKKWQKNFNENSERFIGGIAWKSLNDKLLTVAMREDVGPFSHLIARNTAKSKMGWLEGVSQVIRAPESCPFEILTLMGASGAPGVMVRNAVTYILKPWSQIGHWWHG